MKKKIIWVTPDYFIDCDIDIIPKLLEKYDIYWTVMIPSKDARYNRADFEKFNGIDGLSVNYIFCKYRYRDPRYLFTYFAVFFNLIKQKGDLYYLNYVPTPYFSILAILFFNRKKTILTAHQGEVHSGFNLQLIYRVVYSITYNWFRINNLFSLSQSKLFQNKYPSNKVFMIPLALKSFGKATLPKDNNVVSFFTFGSIRPKKNIDLLIDAACLVYEKGFESIRVVIAGACENWDFYQKRIKYPEIFDLNIRAIDNSEIPNLFSENHYLVLPYTVVTQSGPLKIAFNYNVPVIASDQPGFSDEIIDGVNGYLFKTGDVKDLSRVLINVIQTHNENYERLRISQDKWVQDMYSDDVILNKYVEMFEKIMLNK
ncbi:glycosyltransferase family 4 protein [Flectobacillus rivi]|uniref:Glycosyltransferase family 4 protein n=1 Tax=Flectobacillus rivi TaxID=2984209 RepID=A0ABT6YWU8_9BACT|nr:glycosyltransferase family 4 protein [Flectobacillus rivi]MDI9873360.1 glycosyltransferase family 4 protein [Flectobacillus rivi]